MSFNDIKGQKFAVSYLKKIILKKRIPPTLMFVGKSGTGRFKTALTFAKALNCKNAQADSCDRCKSCIAVENSVHPNVKVIGRNSSVGIGDVRSIVNDNLVPINEGYRVNIIDNADKSTIQAFNSMLKYLEEPPENTVNVLIARDPFNIPETIRSRSVMVKFQPLSDKDIESYLISKGFDSDKAVLVSHLLNGSLEGWEKFSDEDFIKKRKSFIEEMLLFFQGRSDISSLLEKWNALFPDLSSKEKAEKFFDYVSVLIRDILYVSALGEKDNITNFDFLGYIAAKFSVTNKSSLERIYDIIKEQKKALLTNTNPQYAVVDGILRMKEVIV